ncbi:hypothetical protein BDR05DRAFT_948979 [Suillus weaverae]|nr:hypothetical protein BDR05DRAFT_948979 [Suillus weaverae]
MLARRPSQQRKIAHPPGFSALDGWILIQVMAVIAFSVWPEYFAAIWGRNLASEEDSATRARLLAACSQERVKEAEGARRAAEEAAELVQKHLEEQERLASEDDNRALESDFAILRDCEQLRNIEAFIVRSKSDQHINNMSQMKSEKRKRFIDETSQNIQMRLEKENLLLKKVYIICMDAMLATVHKIRSPKAIDEADLLNDVKGFVWRRLQSGCSK